jgi:hypothetical protein
MNRFSYKAACTTVILLGSVVPAFALPRIHRGPTSPNLFKSHVAPHKAPRRTVTRAGMDPVRATAIQTALVKAGYMTSAPTGVWDTTTESAMQKMQSDSGWQTRIVPDARAIIKLGLGSGAAPDVSNASSHSSEMNDDSAAVENITASALR